MQGTQSINETIETSANNLHQENEESFKKLVRKKKRTAKIGVNKEADDKNLGLFISKAKDHASEEILKNYISVKAQIVKRLTEIAFVF